jgi:hypothetical protein
MVQATFGGRVLHGPGQLALSWTSDDWHAAQKYASVSHSRPAKCTSGTTVTKRAGTSHTSLRADINFSLGRMQRVGETPVSATTSKPAKTWQAVSRE